LKLPKLRTLLALLMLLALPGFPARATLYDKIVVQASAAQTANGNSATVALPARASNLLCLVSITAGSGTATAFQIRLQGTEDDGATYYTLTPEFSSRDYDTTPGVGTQARDFVSETAIKTSGKVAAHFKTLTKKFRAQWTITAGSSPSETFEINCYPRDDR
jgi:hypothetical protein